MNILSAPLVTVSPDNNPGLDSTGLVAPLPLASPQPIAPEPQEAAGSVPATKKPRTAKTTPKAATKIKTAPVKSVGGTSKPKKGKPATGGNEVTAATKKEFASCLVKLKLGLGSVAEALQTIHDKDLYKAQYRTWEKFIEAECPYGLAYANRLVQANTILKSATFVAGTKPKNVAQAIALGAAPEAKYGDVMAKAVELAGKSEPTARHIAQAVQVVAPRPKAPANAKGGDKVADTEAAKAGTQPPIKAADALAWLATVRANLKDPAKVEESLALLDLIEHALRVNTVKNDQPDQPAGVAAK